MDKNTVVIAIDHGWSNMKTVHETFTSGIREITTEPALFENVLEKDGKYYKVGSERLKVKDSKVEDENYYLLSLAATAKELDRLGRRNANVYWAVGLPLTRFGKEKEAFIKYLSRNREVTFKYEKKQYHITIERISVYPQCFAAVASQINDLPPKVLVVDIGSYLIDDTVYEIGLEYFTQYDESGKVIKEGKKYDVIEVPEPVGVLVQKTDSTSGNVVKGAGFAVFKDAACTQRVLTDGDSGTEIPVFYYDEDLDGAASEKFAKQQDVYYVKEVVVPDGYRDDGKVWEVKPDYGSFEEIEVTNTPIRCDVSVEKKDKETGNAQGDAALSGATYGLYAMETVNYPDGRGIVSYAGNDNITSTVGTDFYSTGTPANAGTLLATVQTDDSGNFNFGNLYYGKYYIQEIEPSEGYLLDETKYEVDYSKEPNTHQNISVTRHVVETVKKQPFEIIKVSTDGDDTETDYVEGAEFTVKLQSEIDKVGWDAAKVYDTLVTDEKGYACSKELPYGTYLVKETKVPHNLYKTDDFTVEVTEDSRTPQRYRILNDAPFKAYIRMVKKDAESGNTICLSSVTFKIRNTDTDEYVEQKVGKDKVSEFTTDDSGTIITPLKLKYGNYQVEEITAPDGYLISEEEFPFVVEKDGAVKVEEDSDGDPVIEVVIEDTPVKGSISITKAGEVLTGTEYDTIVDRIMSAIDQEDRSLDFIYEEQNLAGAVFQLIAAEDIYTPDHQKDENGKRTLEMINGVPASAGAVVATLTTDENGEASMEDLPLGKYQVVEIEAPKGFVLCEEPFPVELTYKDDHTDVVYGNADFVNERVKTKLSVIKTDGVTKNPNNLFNDSNSATDGDNVTIPDDGKEDATE